MLIQLLVHQPQMLGPILRNTPLWIWGLFAGLVALGLGQAKARSAGRARIVFMPVAMTALSLGGTLSAFGNSPQAGSIQLAWIAAASIALAVTAAMAPPAGAHYDVPSGRFHLPGSWVPMLLITGIFLTKYVVGVDLAMQPGLAHDARYALVTSALYGLFSGVFTGRAARLWRLSFARGVFPAPRAPLE